MSGQSGLHSKTVREDKNKQMKGRKVLRERGKKEERERGRRKNVEGKKEKGISYSFRDHGINPKNCRQIHP